jgi:hypothetical protein
MVQQKHQFCSDPWNRPDMTKKQTLLFTGVALAALLAVLAGCSKADASEAEDAPDRDGFEGQMGYYSGGDLGVQ